MRTSPASRPNTSATARRPSSRAAIVARARGTKARPAAVSSAPRRPRSKSRAPKNSSARWIETLSAGWVTCAPRAAAVNVFRSTTSRKFRTSSSISKSYRIYEKNQFDEWFREAQIEPMAASLLLVLFGVAAGALTTVAGMGGGLLLLLGLSLVWNPSAALAVSSPALLIGNLHRVFLYRQSIDWKLARAFSVGAVPGAVLGSLLAVSVPSLYVSLLMAAMTLLSILRALRKLQFHAPKAAIAPAGLVIGGLTGSAGGAAILTAPLFLSSGLAGETYIATTAASAVAMHLGRIAGYSAGGLFDRERILWALVLALAVIAGNIAGRRLRVLTEKLPESLIEHSILVVCVVLALIGIRQGCTWIFPSIRST